MIEWRLVVLGADGRVWGKYPKKDKAAAEKDAADYENDPLKRTTYIEKRVAATEWVRLDV